MYKFYKIYYLEKVNKIPEAHRTETGTRFYNEEDIKIIKETLNKIKNKKEIINE